ncbi:MAG: hypothetical protein WAV76_09415 [Bacteroidota bacterium]
MNNTLANLPVPVLSLPRWRVNFRPLFYNPERLKSLSDCFKTIEKTHLHLRGWDFPHLSSNTIRRGQGSNWIGSWSDFMGHVEYWRFYQSGQFLYLSSIREVTEPDWKAHILETMKYHFSFDKNIKIEEVPGFIDFVNFNYTVTEFLEFAARLAQAGIYDGQFRLCISLIDIKGFLLSANANRAWDYAYVSNENVLEREILLDPTDVIATSAEKALETIIWFFERFGWLSPSIGILKDDQQKFLKGSY